MLQKYMEKVNSKKKFIFPIEKTTFAVRLFQLIMALFYIPPKPRQFQYRPWYYDERKERLEEMKARARAEIAAEKNKVQQTGLQKGFLSESRENSKIRRRTLQEASNARVLRYMLILIFLLGIFYVLAPDVFLAFWKFK